MGFKPEPFNFAAKLHQIMNAIWYGIADMFTAIFEFIKPIGNPINWLFGIVITIGTIYWLWYDAKVRRGGANYMADKGGK